MAENKQQDSDFGNFLAGFIVGGLVGAAAALLMAPQSGEETRAVIRDRSIELRERAVETAEDARARAEFALEDARMRAEEAAEEVRMRAEELAQVSKQRVDTAREAGRKAADAARSEIEKGSKSGGQEDDISTDRPAPDVPATPDDLS